MIYGGELNAHMTLVFVILRGLLRKITMLERRGRWVKRSAMQYEERRDGVRGGDIW